MSRPARFDRRANYDLSLQKDDDFEDPNTDLQGFVDEPENKYHGGSVDDGLEVLFGNLGNSPRRPLIAKCLFITLVCLAVIAVVVGVGISVIGGDDSNETEHGLSIPSVPVDLHVVCTPMNLRSEEGYSNCLELCQPADCCELPPDSENSCVEQHRHQCELYRSSCQHLDHLKPEVTDEKTSSHPDDESTHNDPNPGAPEDETNNPDAEEDSVGSDETNVPDTDLREDGVISENFDLDLFGGDGTNDLETDLLGENGVGSEDFDLDLFDGDEMNGPVTDLPEEDNVSSEDFDLDLYGGDEVSDQDLGSQENQSNEEVDTDFETLDFYNRNEMSETDKYLSQEEAEEGEPAFEGVDLYGAD